MRCAKPSSLYASSAIKDFLSAGVTGKIATAGTPKSTSSLASSSNKSIDKRSIPGIDSIASRRFLPSSTNTGKIKSFTDSWFSAIRRREKSLRRILRMRVYGKRSSPDWAMLLSSYCGIGKLIT